MPDDALRIPRDADLRAHLAVLAEAGLSERQAIVLSMRFLATAVDDAWNHNVCPRGMLPTMRVQSIHPAARRPRLPIRP